MSTTTPDNLFSPNPSDNYNLIADWATSMQSVQAALAKRGNLYIGTSAQRVAFTTAPDGVHWQDTDGAKLEYIRTSGAWRGAEPLTGTVTAEFPSGGGLSMTPVTFPAGYFESPPLVVVSAATGAASTVALNLASNSVTTSGFNVNANRSNNTATVVAWVAYPRK